MSARELLAAATPRPWTRLIIGGGYTAIVRPDKTTVSFGDDPNLDLVLAAVNEYEALLDIADALRQVCGPYGKPDEWVVAVDALARLDAIRSAA